MISTMRRAPARAAALCALLVVACHGRVEPGRPDGGGGDQDAAQMVPVGSIPGHEQLQDNTRKEGPRLMPAESYIRSYLHLFGGLAPLAAQEALRGDNLFDSWGAYLGALGLPDYRQDIDRMTQTNALMVATFERLGVALCDRAVERELRGATPAAERRVFPFEPTTAMPTAEEFAPRFDAMHRTFLGYPARMAPTDRTTRFYELFRGIAGPRLAAGGAGQRLSPLEAGWAAVCYGLVRHPEFHLY